MSKANTHIEPTNDETCIPAPKLEIVYQDDHLVAINKPSGLLVHRSKIAKDTKQFAVQLLRDQIQQQVYLVHRLDRPTSGVLLFALSSTTAATMAKQFAERLVKKNYLAVVRGFVRDGFCDEPLKEKLDRKTDKRGDPNKPPQPATTIYQTQKTWEVPWSTGKYPNSRYSLLSITPLTGRKHQIRRHFNHIAHPIVGDTTYGDRRHNRVFREQTGVSRLLLAATHLEFTHPVSSQHVVIQCEPGPEFHKATEQLQKLVACIDIN